MPIRRIALALCFSCSCALAARPAFAQTPLEAPVAPATALPAASLVATPTVMTAPRFRDLFTPVKDFKRLTTSPDFRVLTLGIVGAMMAHTVDDQSARATWAPGMRQALAPGDLVGSFVVQTGAAFATYAVGRATRSDKVASVGADLVRTQILAQAATQLIKFTTQRTRPDGTSLSFPSGHTSSSFGTATVLQSHFGWKAGVPAFAVATWVAASRVEKDRHFVSDVVAGAALGIMAGRSITLGRGAMRFAISPMAAPGGLGVSFTRVPR
jgi:membrane-associated phospholipid phosphatase